MITDLASPTFQPATIDVLQTQIAALWSDVLRTEIRGADADFFDAGGNSMLLLAMLELVQRRFDVEIQTDDLSDGVTIGRMAELVQRAAVRG